jgi:ankyrin repeat protein
LNEGIDPNQGDDTGITYFILLLIFFKKETNLTPLHWSVKMQNLEIVELLLDFGADPNKQDFEGATPLHTAGLGNNIEIVKILIASGGNAGIRNEFGTKASELIKKQGMGEALNTPLRKIQVKTL